MRSISGSDQAIGKAGRRRRVQPHNHPLERTVPAGKVFLGREPCVRRPSRSTAFRYTSDSASTSAIAGETLVFTGIVRTGGSPVPRSIRVHPWLKSGDRRKETEAGSRESEVRSVSPSLPPLRPPPQPSPASTREREPKRRAITACFVSPSLRLSVSSPSSPLRASVPPCLAASPPATAPSPWSAAGRHPPAGAAAGRCCECARRPPAASR
jgi:hypothetical protein